MSKVVISRGTCSAPLALADATARGTNHLSTRYLFGTFLTTAAPAAKNGVAPAVRASLHGSNVQVPHPVKVPLRVSAHALCEALGKLFGCRGGCGSDVVEAFLVLTPII